MIEHADTTAESVATDHIDASGSVEPEGVRVRTHPSLCVGWGNCHRFGGGLYPLDEDGLIAIHLLDVPAEHAVDAWRGASVCPEHAITVIGESESYWIARGVRPSPPATGVPADHPPAH